VLIRSGRADLIGAVAGIAAIGALSVVVGRSTAMVVAGGAMLPLGSYVLLGFHETRFVVPAHNRWRASRSIFVQGLSLMRRSRVALVVIAATVLVNGAENVGHLQPRVLIDIGLPTDPVAWFTGAGPADPADRGDRVAYRRIARRGSRRDPTRLHTCLSRRISWSGHARNCPRMR
jgi:hypothetical protein